MVIFTFRIISFLLYLVENVGETAGDEPPKSSSIELPHEATITRDHVQHNGRYTPCTKIPATKPSGQYQHLNDAIPDLPRT